MIKKISKQLFAGILLFLFAQAAWAQTVDDIIEKHLAALGGRATLTKLKSRSMKGTISVTTPLGDLSGPVEILNQQPNKTRTFIELDLSGVGLGKIVQDQRFDGTSGYIIDTLQGNRDITGNQLDNMKNGAFPNALMNYKETGATVELAGKEKVGDRDAYVLLFKPKAGSSARQYIDADSYLPIKVVAKIDVPQAGGEIEQTTEMSDFRDIDGIKVPFQIKTISSLQTVTVTVAKVEHNTPIDPALFSKPDANATK